MGYDGNVKGITLNAHVVMRALVNLFVPHTSTHILRCAVLGAADWQKKASQREMTMYG